MVNIIFDYDGTLHDSRHIYIPAFKEGYAHLVSLGAAPAREFADDEISCWLGMNSKEMWDSFMPSLPQKLKDECSYIVGKAMLQNLDKGMARLFDGSIDALSALKQEGYNLIFLSNCKQSYMNTHIALFGLDRFFSQFHCAEDYAFIPKYEIFPLIKQNTPGEFIVIGDRYHDIEVAVKHGLPSVGCAYGYGKPEELEPCTAVVMAPAEIPKAAAMCHSICRLS